MLRYYDEIGLLKPAQIDKFTGYRLYSVDQLPILHKIILLRDMEFNVSEIALALNNWDENFMTKQLQDKKKKIQAAIQLEQARFEKIEIALKDIKEEKIEIHYNVSLKSIPSFQILSLRKIIPNYNCEGLLWEMLFDFIESENINIPQNRGNIAIYHDEEHKEMDVDVEVGIIVNEMGKNRDEFKFRETEEVETMACVMVYGSYENIAAAYQSFAHWLEAHKQYKMTGLSRQICHRGTWNEENPNKYLTEIQTPVIRQIQDE